MATLGAGLCWLLSTNGAGAWPLAWLAPGLALIATLRAPSGGRAWLRAFLAFALGQLGLARLYAGVVPTPVLLAVIAASAGAFATAAWLARRATGKLPGWAAALVLPCVWTTWELALSSVSPNGTAGSLAYSQVPAPLVVQIASVTGWPGITFLVTAVGAAAAHAIVARDARILAPAALGLAAALAFGAGRLAGGGERPIVVGLASADHAPGPFAEGPGEERATVEAYAPRIAALVRGGAEIVVLPEEVVRLRPGSDSPAAFAAAAAVPLVVGYDDRRGDARRNVAVLYDAGGEPLATYAKRHLVPGFESDVAPGGELAVVGDLGVAICKDLDFPALSRAYARSGARVLLVPAWDFGADGELHAQMAILRGVESGFAVARAARDGRLTASDDRGRLRADAPSAAPAGVIAELPRGSGPTPYARVGDAFGAGVALAALALVVGALRRP